MRIPTATEGVKILSLAVITVQAMQEWDRKNRKQKTRRVTD